MSKEKTEYRFSVHAAPAVINQVIQNYLAANQYVQIPKPIVMRLLLSLDILLHI